MKEKEFIAQKFTLVDDQGNPRAVLSIVNGAVALSLADANRCVGISLIVDETGAPAIQLSGRDGKPRAAIAVADGNPTIGLHDSTGAPRLLLGVTDEGAPVIELLDKAGTRRASLGVGFHDEPGLVFNDLDGTPIYRIPE